MTYPVFDSHCHLDTDAFDADRDEVLARAVAAHVRGIVVPATDVASCDSTAALVARCAGRDDIEVYGTVGVHPHEARHLDDDGLAHIERLSHLPRIVAIGETGLDYHYDFSPPEVQRASLRAQVRLAVRRAMPLVLHCRNAESDLLDIVEAEGGRSCGGVVHCFTGTWETAERFLALGFYLGFTGIITFRNAEALRDVVRRVPIDRLLIETDSPYLAPIPHRGKRNEPAHVALVAETVGPLHGLSAAEAARVAEANTRRCFNLPLQTT